MLEGWAGGWKGTAGKADLDSPPGYSMADSLLGTIMLSRKNWGLSEVAVAQRLAGDWFAWGVLSYAFTLLHYSFFCLFPLFIKLSLSLLLFWFSSPSHLRGVSSD